MESKKRGGQISIFLILAIVVILLGIAFIAYQEYSSTGFEGEMFVEPEFAPVKAFVDECVKQSTDSGIAILGATGGYIEIPNQLQSPRAHLSVVPGLKNPYWWHDGISIVPTESSMTQQLQNHIKEKSEECIGNFESIKDRYDIEERGELDVKVSLNEEDVSVRAAYPLRILYKAERSRKDIDKFFYKKNVRLKKAYELAKSIMEKENAEGFFERRTFDLIALTPEDKIPVNGYEPAVPCRAKTWQFSAVKNEIEDLVQTNLGYIKVAGTDYSTETYVPNPCTVDEYKDTTACENSDGDSDEETNTYGSTYIGQHYVLETAQQDTQQDNNFNNFKVSFRFANKFDKFEIRPNPEGGKLKSNKQRPIDTDNPLLSGIVSNLLCFNQWHFTYDISYPVLVSIFDKPTDKTEPYIFNFAFKVNIDHNIPKRENTGSVLLEGTAISDEDYCGDVSKGIVTISTADENGNAVEGAEVSFICGKFSCDLGKTEFDEFNPADPSAKIIKNGEPLRLPKCPAAVVTATKEDYVDGKQTIVTDNRERSYGIIMKPLKAFPKDYDIPTSFKVVKHDLVRPSVTTPISSGNKNNFLPETNNAELDTDEKALVLIKDYNSDYETSAVFPIEQEESISLLKQPTKYQVEVYIMREEAPVGAFKGNWTTNFGEVENNNEIIFHAIEFEPLSSLSEDEKNEEFATFWDNIEFYSKILGERLNKKIPELR